MRLVLFMAQSQRDYQIASRYLRSGHARLLGRRPGSGAVFVASA